MLFNSAQTAATLNEQLVNTTARVVNYTALYDSKCTYSYSDGESIHVHDLPCYHGIVLWCYPIPTGQIYFKAEEKGRWQTPPLNASDVLTLLEQMAPENITVAAYVRNVPLYDLWWNLQDSSLTSSVILFGIAGGPGLIIMISLGWLYRNRHKISSDN